MSRVVQINAGNESANKDTRSSKTRSVYRNPEHAVASVKYKLQGIAKHPYINALLNTFGQASSEPTNKGASNRAYDDILTKLNKFPIYSGPEALPEVHLRSAMQSHKVPVHPPGWYPIGRGPRHGGRTFKKHRKNKSKRNSRRTF